MLLLGLSSFGQNPGACLLRDGTLVAFAEEERFLRLKGAFGRFPGRATAYCLREAQATLDDVERIAIGWNADKYRLRMPLFFAKTWWTRGRHARGRSHGSIVKELLDQQPGAIRQRVELGLRGAGLAGRVPRIEFFDHHLAHAASTYYASGFDEAAILIMDGSGEERSTSFFHGKGLEIHDEGAIALPDSLGWFYAAITGYLGFTPYEEEGFTMGLAPFGRPSAELDEKLDRVLRLGSDGDYRVDPAFTLLGDHSTSEFFGDRMAELFGPPRLQGQPLEQRHKDVAYAAQARLEAAGLRLVRRASDGGRLRKLCLAGGVALNCKMNGVLSHSEWVDEVFVQPASHDAGTALGAAMLAATQAGHDPRFVMDDARWGPAFAAADVEKALKIAGVRYERVSAIEERAADAVLAGNVVGWFDGRMEVGPRALGGRSILADASRPGMNDVVNARVKFRDPWRPFCPSLTAEAAARYLERPGEARFMTVAYDVPAERRAEIPAVVHVDGTTRPQVVGARSHPRFLRLIERVGKATGRGVVMNTSLNVKGEPIACTPQDALRCLFSSGLDALAIEGFWVAKA
jgi:carbamoyltransferase